MADASGEKSGRTIVIAGASGVVGRHLAQVFEEAGWNVRALTRGAPKSSTEATAEGDGGPPVEWVTWSPTAARDGDDEALKAAAEALDGASLIANLAGATLADGRMNDELKRRILESRLDSTRTLVEAVRRCDSPPPVWFQASATGYYGDTGEAEVTASDPPAEDFFLADVCVQWEAEAKKVLKDPGPAVVRLAIGRIGLVLAQDAPAWDKMLTPIKWGVGGKLGSGQQWWAWIDADDLARAVLHLANTPSAKGIFNFTAPEPVRQIELTKRTAKRLGRPAFMPAPKFMLRLVLGEAADALLLPSCKALPARLLEAGFEFAVPDLDAALDKLLDGRADDA